MSPSSSASSSDCPTAQRWPRRVDCWRLKTQSLHFGTLPVLMGIVNVTPDSFSDGGKYFDHARAIDQALRLAAEGAAVLDIGGESTRPYSDPVSSQDELRRVVPVIEAVCRQTKTPVSVDTSKAAVAREALAAGAEIINDVTALAGDPEMIPLAVQSRAGVCAMHMQGTPQTMQDAPHYDDVVAEVLAWLQIRQRQLMAAGIERDQLALDPGIGFGKTHQHNLTLLAGCQRFHELGSPLVVGHSRKGFIGKVIGDREADRTFGAIGVSLALAGQGVQMLRVHDVRSTSEALALFAAAGGLDGQPLQLS